MRVESVIAGLAGPANVLVTGASSGIGLASVRALLGEPGVVRVFALSRRAGGDAALAALAATHGERLVPLPCDLTSADDMAGLATRVQAHVAALHLVFNAAGVLHGPGLRPEKALSSVTPAALAQVFALNAYAPLLLAQALLPLFAPAQPLVLATLSARVGSIGDNQLGGWYAYRASKAAQNQLMRTLAIEWRRRHPRATVLLLHPGTVDTPLSQPFQANVPPQRLFTPEVAAAQLLAIVARVTPQDSGRFLAWDGSEVPW